MTKIIPINRVKPVEIFRESYEETKVRMERMFRESMTVTKSKKDENTVQRK